MKKGFTLIELLAVIVILAIISLIAIPKMAKIIDNTKEQANLRSLEGHISDMDYSMARDIMSNSYSNGSYSFSDFNFSKFPIKDKIRCSSYEVENGRVKNADGCNVNGKLYCFRDSVATTCDASGLDNEVLSRVNRIRTTSNTDISGRKGPIYYVSNSGSDSNDGLSESTPFKTMDYVTKLMYNKTIPDGSTILFKDGDTFRGRLNLWASDILVGSYGDIKKGKPTLMRSRYDGAKEGKWVEVKKNIWKYTLNNSDKVFDYNVGTLWMFCNKDNKNCSKSMNTIDRKFEYAQMITTNADYDETNIESKIDTLLKNDLEFYHVGHPRNQSAYGKELYLYSTSDPAKRFDEIDFNEALNVIALQGHDYKIDNLHITFGGNHGIGSGTMNNFIVTNCEIGFIGGVVQNYNNNKPTRFGNAIEIYGSVDTKDGYPVTAGFLVDNNYIYQCYDAGPTVQYSTDGISHMERSRFINNVLEYNWYNIEYWNYSRLTSGEGYDYSYIKDFTIENNIMRYAGYGICQTRPDKNQSGHIKTWFHNDGAYNVIKGQILIKNNIFSEQMENAYYFRTNSNVYPILTGNTFYGNKNDFFGYNSSEILPSRLKFNDATLSKLFPNNRFVVKDKMPVESIVDTGKTGDVTWKYDGKNYTLEISGSGKMADYTSADKTPWYKYKDYILKIKVGENVTKLGNYAFAELENVSEVRIDAKALDNLPKKDANNGTNYVLYHTGNAFGTTIVFGPNVTKIPDMLTQPEGWGDDKTNIVNFIFEGNNIKAVYPYGLAHLKKDIHVIPDGVVTNSGLSFGYGKMYLLILPDTITNIADWSIGANEKLEKVVFGPSVKSIAKNTFYNDSKLNTIVIPHIENTALADASTFNKVVDHTLTIYGDSSTETWVNNVKTASGQTNIVYKPLSQYKSSITSNTNISGTVGYNESFSFTANGNVNVYYSYSNSTIHNSLSNPIKVSKNGNTYIINNIKSDIYIEVK